jgi:hypothetical protein
MAVFPDASFAVTVNENALPAVEDAGTELRTRVEAEAGFTVMEYEVSERGPSDAVRVEVPAVFSLIEKDPVPEVRIVAFGSVAAESLEEIATLPEYPVAVFPAVSFAVTEILNAVPEIADAGMDPKTNRVAAPGVTLMGAVFVTGVPASVAPRVTPPT